MLKPCLTALALVLCTARFVFVVHQPEHLGEVGEHDVTVCQQCFHAGGEQYCAAMPAPGVVPAYRSSDAAGAALGPLLSAAAGACLTACLTLVAFL